MLTELLLSMPLLKETTLNKLPSLEREIAADLMSWGVPEKVAVEIFQCIEYRICDEQFNTLVRNLCEAIKSVRDYPNYKENKADLQYAVKDIAKKIDTLMVNRTKAASIGAASFKMLESL